MLTYLLYVAGHPDLETLQKKDLTTLMDIPSTATNYLIIVLKKRGFIVTVGKPGAQSYKPIRLFRDCIIARVKNLQIDVKQYTQDRRE